MAGGAYRITSIDPRYTKLYVKTNRRIYLQNLINLLHASLHKRDAVRAYRSWAILMRCPEIDFRSTWKWALPVLDLVESSQDLPILPDDIASSSMAHHSDPIGSFGSNAVAGPSRLRLIKDGLKESARETYLKRMLVAAHPWQKPEILTSLVVHLLSQQLYEEALDQLDLYLPSFPFALSAIIHTYSGLVLFYLAQPRKTYPSNLGGGMGSSQFVATQHYPSSSPLRGASGQLDAFSSLHLMDGEDDDDRDDDDDNPLRGQARRRAELRDWDAGRLRKALVAFNKAVEIEKEEEKGAAEKAMARARAMGDESLGLIRRAVGGSVARGFVKEIKSMLLVIDGRMDDDADSSADEEEKGGWSEEEPEEPEEDDKMDDSDDEEDDEVEGNEGEKGMIVLDHRSPGPSTPGTPVHPQRRRSESRTPTTSRLASKSRRKTPLRTPTGSSLPSSIRSSPEPTPTSARSMRSTRNPQPMYQTKIHPIDAMDDRAAPPGQARRRAMSSDSSDGDDYKEADSSDRDGRMGRSSSGRGIKRKSRSVSRSGGAKARSGPVAGTSRYDDQRYTRDGDDGSGVEYPNALDGRSEYSDASIG